MTRFDDTVVKDEVGMSVTTFWGRRHPVKAQSLLPDRNMRKKAV
jgi:hypothetical protein